MVMEMSKRSCDDLTALRDDQPEGIFAGRLRKSL
jgi:hypothetical protein